MNRIKYLRYLAAITLAVVVSAMFVPPAFADDGTLPVEPPKEITTETGSGSSEEPAAETEPARDGPRKPAKEESAPTREILSSLPEDTQVVVLNEDGRSLALASQEAETILYEGDPMWCPTGVAPNAGVGGCSPNFATFGTTGTIGSLLNWMATHPKVVAGTIWIAYNYNNALEPTANDNVTIDGLDFVNNYQKAPLTLQGGWNGTPGSGALNSVTPYSTFNGSLSVVNWLAPVTINDILVTSIVDNPNTNAALYVQSTKNITLNRVQVKDNFVSGYSGALLSTTAAPLGAPAAVTVNNSVFNNNFGTGLYIVADGAVRIRNITASYNGLNDAFTDYGLFIDNWWDNANQPVTLSGTNEFKGNFGTGLRINSYGAVTLNNITASYNDDISDDNVGDGWGVIINNNFDLSASNVVLTGTNLISFNQRTGLQVTSNGAITISNLSANFNGQSTANDGSGAILDNCLATACTTTGKPVTLKGTNNFIGNKTNGLRVDASGAILLSNTTASDNTSTGISLDNCNYSAGACSTPALPVTIAGFVTTNTNGLDGLFILSHGAVTLSNITSNFNNWWGLYVDNSFDLLKPLNVTLNGTNSFISNGGAGLIVLTNGAVKTNNLTANYNGSIHGGNGVYIDNLGYDAGAAASVLLVRKPVTMTGFNTFIGNDDYGLEVLSVGAITISSLTANYNLVDGALLDNRWFWEPNGVTTFFAAPITITGFASLNHNSDDGLELSSHGFISLINVTANYNGDHGAFVTAWGFLGPQAVTLAGFNNFMYNGYGSGTGSGLYVQNDGAITISNLNASANQARGAWLDNYAWRWAGKFLGVRLLGFNTFQGNLGTDGLYIRTDGSATLSHINADNNSGDGVDVVATKNITLVCGSAFSNTGTGFSLGSGGLLTLYGLQTYYNGSDYFLSYFTIVRKPCP